MFSIYALTDPRDNSVHYVGRSVNPESRYMNHLASSWESKPKQDWIDQLASAGVLPGLSIIDRAEDHGQAKALEARWILYHVQNGATLVNKEVVEANSPYGLDLLIKRLKVRSVNANPLQVVNVIGRTTTELEEEVLQLRAEVARLKILLSKITALAAEAPQDN